MRNTELQDLAPIQPEHKIEYEPTSAKKLFRMYQQVYERVFVRKVKPYLFKDERIQEIFQKLSRILTVNQIDPEAYLTVQMSILHDTLVKKSVKFHPNMLIGQRALERFFEVATDTQDHGHSVSTDSIESLTGYQELYSDLSISESLFGGDLISTRLSGKPVVVEELVKGQLSFLGENWLVHFREEINLEDCIDQVHEERLELIEQILLYEDSDSYRSNLSANLNKARSNATMWILHRWVPFSNEDVQIERKTLELDPLSYWWSVCNFIVYRIHLLPDAVKEKKLFIKEVTDKELPSSLGQRWSSHLES